MMELICDLYHRLYDRKKKIFKKLEIVTVVATAIFILKWLLEDYTIVTAVLYTAYAWGGLLALMYLGRLFHYVLGKYMLLYHTSLQTKKYVYYEMPKHIKIVGFPGAGKDSIASGISDNVVGQIKADIRKDLNTLAIQLYMFDLKKLKQELKNNPKILESVSKGKKAAAFEKFYLEHEGFISKKYKKKYDFKTILNDFKKNKDALRTTYSEYIINDGIQFEHLYQILLKYAIKYYRLDILDLYLLTNQPFIQSYDSEKRTVTMAGVYSPDFTRTSHEVEEYKDKEEHINKKYKPKTLFPLEDYCLVLETEVDIWWFNLSKDAKEQLSTYRSRSFECIKRHVVGENFRTIRVGQVASRTQASQRDLEEGFIRPIRKVVIDGGQFMRLIVAIKKVLVYMFVWRSKRRKYLLAKADLKRRILANTGYVKFEVIFSRTESIGYTAEPITLYRLLNKEEPLYKSTYSVELVFKKDIWARYNTHYLETKGEQLAAESQINLSDVKRWTPDLKLHRDQILEMNYVEQNAMFKISDKEKYLNTNKYEQLQKPKKNEVPVEEPEGDNNEKII